MHSVPGQAQLTEASFKTMQPEPSDTRGNSLCLHYPNGNVVFSHLIPWKWGIRSRRAREKNWEVAFCLFFFFNNKRKEYSPGSPVVKNPPANEGDTGSNPGQGTETLMP